MGAYIIGDGQDQTIIETATCPHHNRIVRRYTPEGKKIPVATCTPCGGAPVCDLCVQIEMKGGNMHRPFEKKLDDYDKSDLKKRIDEQRARARFLSQMGL